MTSWLRHGLSKKIYAALNRPEFNAFWIARNQNLFSNLSTLKSPPCLESFELNLNFTFPHNRSNPSKRHKLLYDSAGISQIYTWVPLNNPRHNGSRKMKSIRDSGHGNVSIFCFALVQSQIKHFFNKLNLLKSFRFITECTIVHFSNVLW